MGSYFDLPDTGTLRGDLMKMTAAMAARLRAKKFSSAVPSVIDAAERDPEIAAVYSRVHAGFMAPLYKVLERGQERGELPRNSVPTEIVAPIVGPLFYRRWFSRERLDDRFVQGVVERALLATKARPRRTPCPLCEATRLGYGERARTSDEASIFALGVRRVKF